jgi:type I restriction enzyme S subunit
MIEDLKPYPEYKESGLSWLGEVPAHWSLIPNRGLIRRRKVLVGERHCEYLLLSLTKQGVIVRDLSTSKGKFSSDMGTSQEVRIGDLVFCLFDVPETPRTVGLSTHAGMITGAYTVFEPLDRCCATYFELFYRAMDERKLLSPLYSGLRNTIPAERFLAVKTPQPPPEEQAAIARFLAWATNRLDRAIGSKRRIIALLQDQKQAIIHHAVTRGLDPSVPLKDSGIPWLGEIPEHWEVRRTKQLCLAIIDCKNRTPELVEDGEFSVVRTTNIRNGEFNPRGSYSTDRRNFEIWTQRGAPKLGDVFFTREAPVGEACLVPDRIDLCMGQRMMYFRPDPDVLDAGFMLNSIYGPVVRKYIEIQVNGSTVGHLRLGQVSALPLLWCPVTEQKAIVAHIDKLSAPMATAISRLEQEITLLREYRTRLVADVVTGKLDVREVAAGLPEEIQSDDVQDATEEDLDLDAEDEVPENLA